MMKKKNDSSAVLACCGESVTNLYWMPSNTVISTHLFTVSHDFPLGESLLQLVAD